MESSTFDERLVLADQLLAKGDARGELIVVQCELARGGFSRERGISMRKRELELLLAHEDAWANLEGLARNWTFRRGFVHEITIDVTKFVEHEDEIWRRAPYLRWVRFLGLGYDSPIDDLGNAALEWDRVRPRLERALESGRVRYFSAEDARVRWMEDGTMSRHLTGGSLSDVIAQWLPRGRILGIGLIDVGPSVLKHLADLEEIELEGRLFDASPSLDARLAPRRAKLVNRRSPARESELLAGPFSARLEELDTVHVEPVLACAAKLKSVRLAPGPAPNVFEALASAPQLAGLEDLALDVFPGRELELAIEPLYDPKHLEALRTLRLGAGIRVEQARLLLTSRLAQRLELIDLRHASLSAHAEELRSLWDGMILV